MKKIILSERELKNVEYEEIKNKINKINLVDINDWMGTNQGYSKLNDIHKDIENIVKQIVSKDQSDNYIKDIWQSLSEIDIRKVGENNLEEYTQLQQLNPKNIDYKKIIDEDWDGRELSLVARTLCSLSEEDIFTKVKEIKLKLKNKPESYELIVSSLLEELFREGKLTKKIIDEYYFETNKWNLSYNLCIDWNFIGATIDFPQHIIDKEIENAINENLVEHHGGPILELHTILEYQTFDFEKIKPLWKSSTLNYDHLQSLLSNKRVKIPVDFIEEHIDDFMKRSVIENFTINYYDCAKKHIDNYINHLIERHERKNYKELEGHDKRYLVMDEIDKMLKYIPITKEIDKKYIENKVFFSDIDEKKFWGIISENPTIESDFIKKYQNKLDLSTIIYNNKNISEDFLDKWISFLSKEEIKYVSSYINLSLEFIERHGDKLNWEAISMSQYMTSKFIFKNIKKINIGYLKYNQKVNQEELKKYRVYEILKHI